jgi:hypothetical protein
MNLIRTPNLAVGRYLVSPLTRLTHDGAYAPSVSIRSGQGRATHDRVLRFDARFATREAAQHYAAQQGLLWIERAAGPSTIPEETAWPRKN